MATQEQKYAALAPILSLAGMFALPIASTLLPILLFFIFYWQKQAFASRVAIRAADLSFSIQLYIFLGSFLIIGFSHIQPIAETTAQRVMTGLTLVLLIYLVVSLVIAAVQAFRGQAFSYILSLKIAERILNHFQKPT